MDSGSWWVRWKRMGSPWLRLERGGGEETVDVKLGMRRAFRVLWVSVLVSMAAPVLRSSSVMGNRLHDVKDSRRYAGEQTKGIEKAGLHTSHTVVAPVNLNMRQW